MPLFGKPDVKKLMKKRDVDGLIKALRNDRVRSKAEAALLWLGDVTVEPLGAALHSRSDKVRWSALRVLDRLGRSGDAYIVAGLKQEEPQVRTLSVVALGRKRKFLAFEPLAGALGDPNLRGVALQALGELGDPRAVGPILEVVRKEAEHSKRAYQPAPSTAPRPPVRSPVHRGNGASQRQADEVSLEVQVSDLTAVVEHVLLRGAPGAQ